MAHGTSHPEPLDAAYSVGPLLARTLSALLLFFALSLSSPATGEEQLNISGASTIQPILEQSAPELLAASGIALHIEGGGSGAGIRNALSGASHAGAVSRKLSESEKAQLEYVTIGVDTLVFVVNERNPLDRITREQIVSLYSGRTTAWTQFSGFDEPVVLVNLEIGRSTLDIFEEYSGLRHPGRKDVPPDRAILSSALEVGSNIECLALAGGIPGAIAYVSLGTAEQLRAQGLGIRLLELDGVVPSRESIVSGRYPIQRELNLVFTERTPFLATLTDFLLSPAGQRIVADQGFIPVQ